jgi:aromatic ring hydroxylase
MDNQSGNLLQSIKIQIKDLNQRYLAVLQTNQELLSKQEYLHKNIENQEVIIERLNNQLQLLKMTNFANAENENQRTELKNTINEYIKEIDSCIKLLNR